MIKKLKVQNENEQYIIPIQEQIINKSKVKKKIIYIYISYINWESGDWALKPGNAEGKRK